MKRKFRLKIKLKGKEKIHKELKENKRKIINKKFTLRASGSPLNNSWMRIRRALFLAPKVGGCTK